MTPEAEIALTSIAIVSTTTAALGYLWSKYIKTNKMTDTDHNKSVEVLKVIDKDQAEKYLTDYDLQYPVLELYRGDLETRGNWMAVRNEKWRYTVEEEDDVGIAVIKLESWLVTRHQHQFLFEYGRVFRTTIVWDTWNIHINFVVVHPMIPADDMPRVLEVGTPGFYVVGEKAFVISQKAFLAYRMHPIEIGNGREVTVGKRLLFHCIVNRDEQPGDFDVASFVGWPAGMVLDMMGRQTPGSQYNTYSMEEAGLYEVENGQANGGEVTETQGEELLIEENGSEEKRKEDEIEKRRKEIEEEERRILDSEDDEPLVNFVFKPTSPPPTGAVDKVYHDTDLTRRRRKRKYKRTPGMRTKMVKSKKRKVAVPTKPGSPIKLTKSHEMEIVRHLVMGIDPKAKAYWTAYHKKVAKNRTIGIVPEEKEGPFEYGSGPGGWSLSAQEKEEDMRMFARSPNSSVLSPQGELSQNLSSSATGTPGPKKPRKNTGTDSDVSVVMSPFLSMKGSEEKVISILSEDEGLRKVRVNLGELLESGRIVWPEDGMLSQIQVEMDEEEVMPDVETESEDDKGAIVIN